MPKRPRCSNPAHGAGRTKDGTFGIHGRGARSTAASSLLRWALPRSGLGYLVHFPAVFAEPIVAETGWSLGWVVGGTSIGLLTAGLISPQVGRIIDARGGRPVLLASSTFYAAGLAGVGLAPALPFYLCAWVLIGIGMGTGLYDAVFAALGRMYGNEARGPITNLTLFGGFASTIAGRSAPS